MNQGQYQRYLRLSNVVGSMREVLAACKLLCDLNGSNPAVQVILAGLVASYARPFGENKGAGSQKLKEFTLTASQEETHGHLLTARDKIYAHTDFVEVFKQQDGGEIQHGVQVIVLKSEFTHEPVMFRLFAPIAEQVRDVAGSILKQAESAADDLIRGHHLEDGTWELQFGAKFIKK